MAVEVEVDMEAPGGGGLTLFSTPISSQNANVCALVYQDAGMI